MNWTLIDKRRTRKRLTWAALAAQANISPRTIENWRKGGEPDPHKFEAFEAVLIEHGLLRVSTR